MNNNIYQGFLADIYDYSPYFGIYRQNLSLFYLNALNNMVHTVVNPLK